MSGLDTSQPISDAASLHAGGEDEAAAPFDREVEGSVPSTPESSGEKAERPAE